MRWNAVFLGLAALAAGLGNSPAGAQTPVMDCSNPNRAHGRLVRYWRGGYFDAAEAQMDAILAGGCVQDAAISYQIFVRGQCDLDPSDPRVTDGFRARLNNAGLRVCRVSREQDDPKRSAEVLAAIRNDNGIAGRLRLYDLFARGPKVNTAALAWLRRYDRFDPLPHFGYDGDALTSQILAGRVENVRLLLEAGYSANKAVLDPRQDDSGAYDSTPKPARRGLLPLAAARRALATHGEAAVQITELLLDAGADPYKLEWYAAPEPSAADAADPRWRKAFEASLDDAKSRHTPIGVEFTGFLTERDPRGSRMYARFLVGNGGPSVVQLPAWRNGEAWKFDGLPVGTRLERQLPGATEWHQDLLISHGWSPSTRIELLPSQSVEVWYNWNEGELLEHEPLTRYRLRIMLPGDTPYSEPFIPQYPQEDRAWVTLPVARDW